MVYSSFELIKGPVGRPLFKEQAMKYLEYLAVIGFAVGAVVLVIYAALSFATTENYLEFVLN